MRRLVVLLACATAALLAGCGSGASRHPASAGASRGGLPELTSIRQLQTAFDARPRDPKLLILLSPT